MGYCLETAIGAVPTGNHAVEKQVKCRPQQTLCRSVRVVGTGYWSGVENHVELRPGVADSGIRFIREDLDGACVPVSLHNRIDAEKRTNLQVGEARIEMVEHVLSALAAMGIDCCEIGLTAAELPGLDGSDFSTNYRRFKFEEKLLAHTYDIYEITRKTVPEDFRNARIHRSWKFLKKS